MIFTNTRCKQCGTVGDVYGTMLCLSCTIRNKPVEKPPLGLTPKFVRNKERKIEIIEAIIRYLDADKKIPEEWIEEFVILNKLKKD